MTTQTPLHLRRKLIVIFPKLSDNRSHTFFITEEKQLVNVLGIMKICESSANLHAIVEYANALNSLEWSECSRKCDILKFVDLCAPKYSPCYCEPDEIRWFKQFSTNNCCHPFRIVSFTRRIIADNNFNIIDFQIIFFQIGVEAPLKWDLPNVFIRYRQNL